MPIKHAAEKALRQAKKNALKNRFVKETVKTLVKKTRRSIAEKKFNEARDMIKKSVKALDKAARAGVLKKNTASRLKSRLMTRLNAAIKK